jgi:hypothetical protein
VVRAFSPQRGAEEHRGKASFNMDGQDRQDKSATARLFFHITQLVGMDARTDPGRRAGKNPVEMHYGRNRQRRSTEPVRASLIDVSRNALERKGIEAGGAHTRWQFPISPQKEVSECPTKGPKGCEPRAKKK